MKPTFFKIAALGLFVLITLAFFHAEEVAPRSYNFSVTPWGNESEMKAMFRPFLDYIEENTGVHFDIVILPTYDDIIKELTSGYVSFAAVNAVSYLKLRRKSANMKYLVTSVRNFEGLEKEHYIGHIIVKKGSKINSLEGLRGKVFGFVEENSGSGYKMPRAILGLSGETPETFFKKYFFLGDHDEVAKAVLNGCVDGGATWEASYKINTEKLGDVFKIIYNTPPIPNDAWVARPEIPDHIAMKIKELMLGMDRSTRTIDGRIVLDEKLGLPETGFIEKPAEFYENAAPLLLYEGKSIDQ